MNFRTCAIVSCASILLGSAIDAQTEKKSSTPPPTPERSSVPQPARRVRVKLEGFDLAPSKKPQENTQVGSATRGGGGPLPVLYAPNKARVYSLTPLFSWGSKPAATKFIFRLFDIDDQQLWQKEVDGHSLRYGADAPALQPGTTYRWTVEPTLALLGGPADSAEIVVMSDVDRQRIAPLIAAAGLAAAQVFIEQRLWYDAVDNLSELITKNPTDAVLYEQRGTVYNSIDATVPLADQDFAKAAELRR